MFSKNFFYGTLFIALLSCESSGDGSAVDAPTISLSCAESQCGVSGFRDAVVVLSLSGCSPDQIDFEDVTTGSTSLSCNGGSCSGSLERAQWSPETLSSRVYYVCGWIDIDDNGVKNSNDVFSEDRELVSADTSLTISSWSVTYSFLIERAKKH